MGFIFQVRLPRHQLYVCRISPKTRIEQILQQVCREKGLDPRKYEVRKTGKKPFLLSKDQYIFMVSPFGSTKSVAQVENWPKQSSIFFKNIV